MTIEKVLNEDVSLITKKKLDPITHILTCLLNYLSNVVIPIKKAIYIHTGITRQSVDKYLKILINEGYILENKFCPKCKKRFHKQVPRQCDCGIKFMPDNIKRTTKYSESVYFITKQGVDLYMKIRQAYSTIVSIMDNNLMKKNLDFKEFFEWNEKTENK